MTQTIGIVPLGRETFDVEYANQKLAAMLEALDSLDISVVGSRSLLFDAASTGVALDQLAKHKPDRILVLQVTFTDAQTIEEIAARFDQPLAIWAVPEPRQGGRLRLNAFCGLNLASHTLGLTHKSFGYLYGDAGKNTAQLEALLRGELDSDKHIPPMLNPGESPQGQAVVEQLRDKQVARVGDHPAGFSTCRYDCAQTRELTGVDVTEIPLETLFDTARATEETATGPLLTTIQQTLSGVDKVDAAQLDRSLRLRLALDQLQAEHRIDAFAIRCWPETFTEYGGAVCGAVSMLGEALTPCACEADVYGAITQLMLQATAQQPVFLVDVVDLDIEDNTGVVWHCGQAPLSMCNPDVKPAATIHTNRRMPLLYEFPLKPGRVTYARLSQARGTPKLMLGVGTMLDRSAAFTGTSGVIEFDNDAQTTLDNIIGSGLEHHVGIVYGDHRSTLEGVAGALNLPVVHI